MELNFEPVPLRLEINKGLFMFYRRKVLLSLLKLNGGELEKIRLQKLLFLFCQEQKKPTYEFVPYKYGCYSFSAAADLSAMKKRGMIDVADKSVSLPPSEAIPELKITDRKILERIVGTFQAYRTSDLIRYTYVNYPFYASRSTIIDRVLPKAAHDRLPYIPPHIEEQRLFTIGYEGISVERYLQKLLVNDVRLLIDVRKNAQSMKWGFSKGMLKNHCEKLGIEYLHIPDVGIESNKRRTLNTQADYDALFEDYKQTTLQKTTDAQHQIISLLEKYGRVALTCFEAKPCECHRTHLAENLQGFKNDLKPHHL